MTNRSETMNDPLSTTPELEAAHLRYIKRRDELALLLRRQYGAGWVQAVEYAGDDRATNHDPLAAEYLNCRRMAAVTQCVASWESHVEAIQRTAATVTPREPAPNGQRKAWAAEIRCARAPYAGRNRMLCANDEQERAYIRARMVREWVVGQKERA